MTTSAEDGRLAALLEAMLASSLDAVVTIDASARVLMFNRAAEETFGYREADALGRDIADLIVPEHLRERHRAGLARHLADGTRVIMDRRVELTGLRSDGSEFPVELTVTRVPLDGPPVFTAYLRDITERKRTEAELRASRTRVVESADRERRRIERNLHDGAQQRLVSIGLLLHQVARAELDGPSRALVSLVQEEAGRAIEELRELARGIHPASLTDGGLRNALVGLGRRSALEVTVDAPDRRLPASVEVALYYVAAESLANVAKYAGIERASVSVAVTETEATLTVVDEGAGGADPSGGTGLAGLVDRIEAIGGRLEVQSPTGGGTTVVAVAPLP